MAMPRLDGSTSFMTLAADVEFARGDVFEARDHAQQGGLSAARGTDEDDEFPALDVEIDALDHLEGAE